MSKLLILIAVQALVLANLSQTLAQNNSDFNPNTNDSIIFVEDTVSIPNGSRMTSDYLQNLYIITPTNDIIKYDKTGKKLATANYKVLGNIGSIDASNPFELYVFYRDQNQVLFLDNLLNMRGSCNLETINVSQVACLGRSFDNQIWLFDLADLKLKKFSKELKLLLESASFNSLPIGNNINPSQLIDNNNQVYILNNLDILEFDIFANYNKIILKDSMSGFQWQNNQFFYFKNHKVNVFTPKNFSLDTKTYDIPENTTNIRIEKERLYILTDEYVILRTYLIKK
jgi:hypothetical protein